MHTGLRRDVQVEAVVGMRLAEGAEEMEEMIAVAEDVHRVVAGEVVVEEEAVAEEEAAAEAAAVVGVEVEVVDVKGC